jgi:ribosomal protein L44E
LSVSLEKKEAQRRVRRADLTMAIASRASRESTSFSTRRVLLAVRSADTRCSISATEADVFRAEPFVLETEALDRDPLVGHGSLHRRT